MRWSGKSEFRATPSAGGWHWHNSGLIKEKRMGDGEITSMLLGIRDDKFFSAIYHELVPMLDARYRALVALLASYAFALLVLFGAPDAFVVAGTSVKVEAWPHIAIAIISFFSWRYSELSSKIGFQSTYFEFIYASGSAERRAEMLLLYPRAFSGFQFNRTVRGFPKHVWPKSWPSWEGFTMKVVLALAATIWLIPIAIFGFGIRQVWVSGFPDPVSAKIFVVSVLVLGLISIANPFFTNLKRRYIHYGASNVLSKLPASRKQDWYDMLNVVQEARAPTPIDPPPESA